jgi:hypothetical protein
MLTANRLLGMAALIAVLTFNTHSITWFPEEFTCPIDSQKNTFLVVGSWGSYIYSYPSRFQFLFFPRTDSPTFYTCKKCHLSTFMWDFAELPKDKLPAIKDSLKGVQVSKAFKEYTELPVTERMEIMQKVYGVLEKDDSWRESFYRTKGYHYAKEGDAGRAAESRKKSVELLQKMIADEKNDEPKKLLYYVLGAMKHFLGDDEGAIADLNRSRKTVYAEKDGEEEEMKEAEAGLNYRIDEYIKLIGTADKKPRLTDKSEGHGH